MSTEPEPWYAVRCIFSHGDDDDAGRTRYEERIVVVLAQSIDEAIARAEVEAEEYASGLGGDTRYLGDCDAYHLAVTDIGDGSEVFSLIRRSELGPKEYVRTFFQTGQEFSRRQRLLAPAQKYAAVDFSHAVKAGEFVVKDASEQHEAIRLHVFIAH